MSEPSNDTDRGAVVRSAMPIHDELRVFLIAQFPQAHPMAIMAALSIEVASIAATLSSDMAMAREFVENTASVMLEQIERLGIGHPHFTGGDDGGSSDSGGGGVGKARGGGSTH